MFRGRRRSIREDPLVTLEVPESTAKAFARLTERDIERLVEDRWWFKRFVDKFKWIVFWFLIGSAMFIWGPYYWDWQQFIYDQALNRCTSVMSTMTDKTKLNTIVTEDQVSQTCQELVNPLKPPPASKPWDRFQVVWNNFVAQPAKDAFGYLFIDGYTTWTLDGGSAGTVDFSGDLDANGNPSLKAVVQEAIRYQPNSKVPWRYVVDACYYESGGLKHFASPGVLTQGKNPDSIDWGLCQINDKWHPDLMDMAKKDWKSNLHASFMVFEPRWKAAQNFPEGEERLRELWALYNGSGPYDAYATRVLAVHQTLEPRIAQILREFENSSSEKPLSLPNDSIVEGTDEVVVTMDTRKDVPVYDGESANIVEWATLNQSWEIINGGKWSFCDQTDSTGWSSFKYAANIDAGGICANATQIDFAVKKFGRGLTVDPYLDHWGSFQWFKVAINCPYSDYVVHNASGKTVVFEQFMDGGLLKLRIRFK